MEELGAAIEMLHTYSLIHDDLPALDNDDLRRGKPTCHVVFGEAIAILAGDALQTLAYQTLSKLRCPATGDGGDCAADRGGDGHGRRHDRRSGARSRRRAHEADSGERGCDSSREDRRADSREPGDGRRVCGRRCGGCARLTEFGRKAGLAFQIVDDVLDVTQDSEHLGKTAGKDLTSDKATWPAVFGIEASRAHANKLIAEAFAVLAPYGDAAEGLKAVARYLVERTN